MANTLQLKNDIKKLKTALASKSLSASIKNKLKGKLEKAEKDLKSTAPRKATTAKSTIASLKELVKKKKYSIYKKSGVDLKKDSEEPALPIGRRVSKGIKGNQYGNKKSSKGNVYYEYRANRLDVKQPSKTAKYPKLADGGEVFDADYWEIYNEDDGVGSMHSAEKLYVVDIKELVQNIVDDFNNDNEMGDVVTPKDFNHILSLAKKFYNKKGWISASIVYTMLIQESRGEYKKGGMMAKGGENTTELQKYLKVASDRAFAGGGNGVNITDYGLSEVAIYINQDIYTTETKNLFKKLVDSMVKDEIKNNQVGANDYKKGGMMAHGGKLSKKDFFKKYEENEDENMHTENVVLLAENYGTESDIRDAKTILAKHESIGHLPTSLRQERDALHDKLYAKYVQSREDGGMMAEGGKLKFTTMTEESFLDKYSDTNVYPESVQNTFDIIRYGSNDKNKLDGFLSAMKLNGYKVKEKGEFALAVKKRNIKEDGGMMAEGGVTEKEVVDSNAEMVLSNVKEVKHHADELSKVVTKKSNIEAWVVAKIERASTDLSDISHYLEGQHDKMSMGGSVYNHLHKMDKK